MAQLVWDQVEERVFETGIDHGVLYIPDNHGAYVDGVAWNGLTTVTEKPSGADPTVKYADNIPYLSLRAAERFGGTIEAITYPDEWEQFDGIASPASGLAIAQQNRKSFGMSYRTLKGNAVVGDDLGYKVHLVYGATASPSEKGYTTVNDTPDTLAFSWDFDTQPVAIGTIDGVTYKPTALLVVDSTKVLPATMAALELLLYGSVGVDPALPMPATVITMITGGVVEVAPNVPAFNQATNTITIPAVAGVTYYIDGVAVPPGPVVITEDTIVQARPNEGYVFTAGVDDDWFYNFV